MTGPILPDLAPVLCSVCNSHIMTVNTQTLAFPFRSQCFEITRDTACFGAWEIPAEITIDLICPSPGCSEFPLHFDANDGVILPLLTLGRWDKDREVWEPFMVRVPKEIPYLAPDTKIVERDGRLFVVPADEDQDHGQEVCSQEGRGEAGEAVQKEVALSTDPGRERCAPGEEAPGDQSPGRQVGSGHAERADGERAGREGEPRGFQGHDARVRQSGWRHQGKKRK